VCARSHIDGFVIEFSAVLCVNRPISVDIIKQESKESNASFWHHSLLTSIKSPQFMQHSADS